MTRRLPAEWEPQAAIWLAWPHNKADWPDRFGPIPWAYGDFVRHIAAHQRVRLLVKHEAAREQAESVLSRLGVALSQVEFITAPTDRVWLRDSGGIIVYEGFERLVLDWRFNGWAKYGNWKRDDAVPQRMAEHLGLARHQPLHNGKRVVMEGGALDGNGAGALLVTEECLLSAQQCRNPGFTREDYEAIFAREFGVETTIWLGHGIVGDDTHGHVDDISRFVAEDVIVTVLPENAEDADYAPMQENAARLRAARNAKGRPFHIVPLPAPRPLYCDGERLPASYANFLITNQTVLVPTFNDVSDASALAILSELFPGRDVIGIHCGDVVWGLGTLHCASQQEPA